MLTACGAEHISAAQTAEQDAALTESVADETATTEDAVTSEATQQTVTEPLPEESTMQQDEESRAASDVQLRRTKMEQLILDKAEENGAVGEIFPIAFGDYDESGKEMLIAIFGSMEEHDGKPYYYGSLWTADESYASDVFGYNNIDTTGYALTDIGVIYAGGDVLLTCTFGQGTEQGMVMLWEISEARLQRVDVIGCTAVGITQTEDCEFTAVKTEYGAYSDGTGRTYKPYRYTYDPDSRTLRQHKLRQATWEQVSAFGGADAIADRIGGEVQDYLLTAEGELYVNYTIGEENRYLCYEVADGTLVDVTPEDALGHYSADVTFEQARLERLILDSIPDEDKRGSYTISDTLFGDFDGDGIEELAAIYGAWDIWFASGDKAEKINSGELVGVTQTADGTFMNFYTPGVIGGVTVWYHLQDSTLVCSQPEDWYSARIFNSYETGDWYAELMTGHDEERGYLWETVALEFDKEKRKFKIIVNE